MTHRCTLPSAPASVGAARRFVENVLQTWGVEGPGWTCVLLTSELATNAVLHARSDFAVELSRSGDVIRVSVHDTSPAAPGVRRYTEDSTTGRGLRMVDSMADGWGVDHGASGKTVWFELDTARRGTARSWDDGSAVDLDPDSLLAQFPDELEQTDVVLTLRPSAGPPLLRRSA